MGQRARENKGTERNRRDPFERLFNNILLSLLRLSTGGHGGEKHTWTYVNEQRVEASYLNVTFEKRASWRLKDIRNRCVGFKIIQCIYDIVL